jgi:hypothetical protein
MLLILHHLNDANLQKYNTSSVTLFRRNYPFQAVRMSGNRIRHILCGNGASAISLQELLQMLWFIFGCIQNFSFLIDLQHCISYIYSA